MARGRKPATGETTENAVTTWAYFVDRDKDVTPFWVKLKGASLMNWKAQAFEIVFNMHLSRSIESVTIVQRSSDGNKELVTYRPAVSGIEFVNEPE